MPRFLRVNMLMVLGLIGLAYFNPATAQADAKLGGYGEEDCYVSGLMGKMRCYSLVRPLHEGSDETITLKGVIVPSDAVVPKPDPLVILAGGPGQAASDMVAMFTKLFRVVNSTRDLIFFDIRGTGLSTPVSCEEDDEDIPPLTHVPVEKILSQLERCRRDHGDLVKGATTKTAVGDLDALRQALGVDQFNLWGGSYGTRFAQYYIHSHEAHVRSAILDAVVPFSPSYLTLQGGHALKALNQVTAACAADGSCAKAFPGFDPIGLLDRIEEGREISYRHPVTGAMVTTATSRTKIVQTMIGALYSPGGRAFIPFALTQAVQHDNWGPMAAMAVDAGRYVGMTTIYMGAFLSITCAEEAAALHMADLAQNPLMKEGDNISMMRKFCDLWPAPAEPLPSPEDGSISVPIFMISGGIDPITPPELADHAMKSFTNVEHFILKSGGHINSTTPCVAAFLIQFVKSPDDDDLEPQCIGDGYAPAFVLSPTGPAYAGGVK